MPSAEWRVARPASRRRTSVSRGQVETIAARAVGIAGLVFGAQTVPAALAEASAMRPGAGAALMAVVYGAVAALAVATLSKVAVRTACLSFAALYLLALLSWPALVEDTGAMTGQVPWLYFLCTVATTAAVVALPIWWAVAYTVVVPVIYGVIRVLPAGGGVEPLLAVLDATYAVILGIVVLAIISMLRQAAAGVDQAQEAALQRYDLAARLHANELERAKVDALVHDSVLTTLLAAAAATTPDQRALAARMARDAITRLDDAGAAGPRSLERVALTVLVRRLRTAIGAFNASFTVRVVNAGGVELPVEAVEALYSAAVQAMVNSLQHADEPGRVTRRELRIRGVRANGAVIEVADNGVGFDPRTVPRERLGVRVSIEERMTNAGGSARVESAPGHGTTIVVGWPTGAIGGDS